MQEIKSIAAQALTALQQGGANKGAVSAAVRETKEFNVDNGKFSLFRTLYDHALSLTALCDGKRGTVGINRFDDAAVADAVQNCLEVANSGKADPSFDIAPAQPAQQFALGAPVCDTERLFARTQELLQTIQTRHPKIVVEQMIVSHTQNRSVFTNSNGVLYERYSGVYAVELTYSAHEGTLTSSFCSSGVLTDRLDRPFYSLGSIAAELADAEQQIHVKPVSGKFTGTLVLTPGCFAELLWAALDNFAEDTALISGTSIWKDRLGTVVADPRLTVSLRPFDPRIVCGERVTDDGFFAEDFDVIEKGVLRSFLLSLYAANKTGLPRAKNSSGALIVAPGDTPLQTLIGSVERGLLVGRFSGGEPSANGDFSGVAKNSFLIENGKIAGAVSETMISGNLAALLQNLRGLSVQTVEDGATSLPWAAFDGVTISGK